MRATIRSLLVVVAIATTVFAGRADLTLMAVNQPYPEIASVLPARGAVVGVAHPVVVTLRGPVADRTAVERTLRVTSEPAMTGRFEWLDVNVVRWVPDRYWPAHSTVALSVGGLRTDFKTGPKVVGVADVANHTFTVSIDDVAAGPPPPPCRRRITGRTGASRGSCPPRWAGRSSPPRSATTPCCPKTAR